MGREIRRVPPDWRHPTIREMVESGLIVAPLYGSLDAPWPLYDQTYRAAAAKWKRGFAAWEADEGGERSRIEAQHGQTEYWEYHNHPRRESYRDREWTADEATAYQVYEDVSEGTPVSPVLPTRDDMIAWLMRHAGLSQAGAEAFADQGYVFSGIVGPNGIAVNYQQIEPSARLTEEP